MLSHDEQTIIAQSTPKGPGAIALLRLSGVDAVLIAEKITELSNKKKLSQKQTHTIHYGAVIDKKRAVIDKVLIFLMHAPHTFTGQNTVEISCHNNPFIIQAIIAAAIEAGARMAHKGEFSKRSVINDKIDLVQAEAINELIHANNEHALKQSLAQLDGSLSQEIQTIEKNLITALAYADASFEFIDEEHLEFGETIRTIIQTVTNTIEELLASFDQQKQIRSGIRITLIGSVNAGKSSLFNMLVGDNRAIVTALPGTTRDVIEASFYSEGLYWTLEDTAGLRQTDDIIEKEGIKRSLKQAHMADIILLIIDSSRIMGTEEMQAYERIYHKYATKIIPIHHKRDCDEKTAPLFKGSIASTTHDLTVISLIKKTIAQKITMLFHSLASTYLLNERHYNRLIELKKSIDKLQPLLTNRNIPYELVSYYLNEILAHCAEISGKSVSHQVMDAVFRQFCVGK